MIRKLVPLSLRKRLRKPPPIIEPTSEEQRAARLKALFVNCTGTNALLEGKVLEIGPSLRPMAPRCAGYDVTIVDHLDTASLREKYKDTGVDLDIIEEVNYVWEGQPLPELVGRSHFDWAIAAHVAEHTPDLIQFLNDFGEVLTPTGRLGLVLPDKRFCFDSERPSSTIARIIDAHERRDIRPSVGAIAEHCIYAIKQDESIAWVPGATGHREPVLTIDQTHDRINRGRAGEYIDVHVWCFTMDEFRELVAKLQTLGLLNLEISRIHQPDNCPEFYVEFQRTMAN